MAAFVESGERKNLRFDLSTEIDKISYIEYRETDVMCAYNSFSKTPILK